MNILNIIRQTGIFSLGLCLSSFFASCEEEGSGWDISQVEDDPEIPEEVTSNKKAPLYWTVYEYCFEAEHSGQSTNMPKGVWEENIKWVSENLKPYGYNMICTDGFMSMYTDMNVDDSGYMTNYGEYTLKELVALCKQYGLKLGVYDNPLWIHGPLETKIEGTNIPFSNLLYDPAVDQVNHPNATGDIFTWVVASHKGAKEYIDGFFKYYKNLGVDFIRMDFMCLYETGGGMAEGDAGGRGYGRENYRLALEYIKEAADKYGVFTSIVMPNCVNNAEYESQYCDMFRVDADTFNGTFDHVNGLSDSWFSIYGDATYYRRRGDVSNDKWPTCYNMFDGFLHWSSVSGRDKIILDGDFTRLATLTNDAECEFAISLQLLAGGPIAVADQYNSANIDQRLRFYQNEEMLALNTDKFVGKPLAIDYWNAEGQIWYGQMSNGDYVVGLFNRENTPQVRSLNLSQIGINQAMKARDLWRHQDEGEVTTISVTLEPHACKVIKLSK